MRRAVVEVAATTSVRAVLAWLGDDELVAVRGAGEPPSWHVVPAARLRVLAEAHVEATGSDERLLAEVVATLPSVAIVGPGAQAPPGAGALLVDADGHAVGWLEPDGPEPPVRRMPGSGGVEPAGAPAGDDGGDHVVRRGGLFGGRSRGGPAVGPAGATRSAPPVTRSAPPPMRSAPPPAAPPPSPPPAAAPPPAGGPTQPATASAPPPVAPATAAAPPGGDPPPPSETVTAHARVEAPEQAPPATEVVVDVGLAEELQPGVTGSAMELPRPTTPGEPIHVTVQLAAAGCGFPQGNLRRLDVDPDDVGRVQTSFLIETPDVEVPTDVMLQVDFSVDEQLVGKAWRALRVQPPAAPAPAEPVPAAGQTAVDLHPRTPVDLTIKVLRGETDDELLWLATTPLPGVAVPEHQVSSRLDADDARDFALAQVAKAEKADEEMVGATLTGMARTVARAMPREVWDVVAAVWRAVRDEGRDRPSVLIATSEAWVPWELASVEEEFVADQSLLDPEAPKVLGCQVRLGRWVQPGFASAAGMTHTDLPPPSELALTTMAVVLGRYEDSFDFAELPEAALECQHLAETFPSVRVEAEAGSVMALLTEEVELPADRTPPVDVVHIACHGKVDPLDPLRSGIVLSDGRTRVHDTVVAGGSLRGGRPLVFVNACQLATTPSDQLGNQGGLAAAFLSIGARAYIAPLWSVEDVVAREIAEELHRQVLVEHVPVGEAVRRARSRFATDPTSATPLAYVYYGHPDLVMTTD